MSRLIDADRLKAYLQDKYVIYDSTLADIDAQPTVDPVIHGHWEYHRRHQRDCVASCSVCKKRTTFFFKNGTEYCPFCGAKMDEVGE